MRHTFKRTLLATSLAGSIALVAAPMAVAPGQSQAPATPTDFTAIVRQKMPAVVAILTKQMIEQQEQDASEATTLEDLLRRRFGGRRDGEGDGVARTSLGSGFVISRDGYI